MTVSIDTTNRKKALAQTFKDEKAASPNHLLNQGKSIYVPKKDTKDEAKA